MQAGQLRDCYKFQRMYMNISIEMTPCSNGPHSCCKSFFAWSNPILQLKFTGGLSHLQLGGSPWPPYELPLAPFPTLTVKTFLFWVSFLG